MKTNEHDRTILWADPGQAFRRNHANLPAMITMKTFIPSIPLLLATMVLRLSPCAQAQTLTNWTIPEARVNVKVLGESETPISGVAVWFAFCEATNGNAVVNRRGLTDLNGQFSAQGSTEGTVGSQCQKQGYYSGGFPIPSFTDATNGRWQPWDATFTTVLRKIEDPVPMYAKNVFLRVPKVAEPCGYDLQRADWVSPWGKGQVADFIFTMGCAYTNFGHNHVSVKLTFSNPLDGIQAAKLPEQWSHGMFIWHRQAPDTGYVDSYEMEFGVPNEGFRVPGLPRSPRIRQVEALKYYFRVRTVVQDGRIVSALYGKLSQGFLIGVTGPTNTNVRTCYYLNPTPLDRNMEFDLKQNLFKNLKSSEEPRRP